MERSTQFQPKKKLKTLSMVSKSKAKETEMSIQAS